MITYNYRNKSTVYLILILTQLDTRNNSQNDNLIAAEPYLYIKIPLQPFMKTTAPQWSLFPCWTLTLHSTLLIYHIDSLTIIILTPHDLQPTFEHAGCCYEFDVAPRALLCRYPESTCRIIWKPWVLWSGHPANRGVNPFLAHPYYLVSFELCSLILNMENFFILCLVDFFCQANVAQLRLDKPTALCEQKNTLQR